MNYLGIVPDIGYIWISEKYLSMEFTIRKAIDLSSHQTLAYRQRDFHIFLQPFESDGTLRKKAPIIIYPPPYVLPNYIYLKLFHSWLTGGNLPFLLTESSSASVSHSQPIPSF